MLIRLRTASYRNRYCNFRGGNLEGARASVDYCEISFDVYNVAQRYKSLLPLYYKMYSSAREVMVVRAQSADQAIALWSVELLAVVKMSCAYKTFCPKEFLEELDSEI